MEKHEILRFLGFKRLNLARKNRQNIIVDATLKDYEFYKSAIQTFKDLGYKTKLYATSTKPELSVERVTKRFLKTGRYVPLEYAYMTSKVVDESIKKLTNLVDEYKIYDTTIFGSDGATIIKQYPAVKT